MNEPDIGAVVARCRAFVLERTGVMPGGADLEAVIRQALVERELWVGEQAGIVTRQEVGKALAARIFTRLRELKIAPSTSLPDRDAWHELPGMIEATLYRR